MRSLFLFSFICAAALARGAAASIVLEFDSVPDTGGFCPVPTSVVEQGITISSCPSNFAQAGTIHLDDSGTGYEDRVSFSSATPFDALSMVVRGFSWGYIDHNSGAEVPFDDMLFRGFRGGTEVARTTHSSYALGLHTVLFPSDFSRLHTLEIRQVLPSPEVLSRNPGALCDAPCAHVDLERLTLSAVPLSPVPLPAAFLPFLIALGIVNFRAVRRWLSAGSRA